MLRFTKGRLRWGDEDVVAMANVLGAEPAAKAQAPLVDSILKAAARRGVRLSERLRGALDDARRSRKQLRALKDAEDAPATSKRERRFFPHQRADLAYIRETRLDGYLLAHQPGVGKTLVALWWALRILKARRVLVITPNSAKDQWRDEIARWAPGLPVTIVEGTKADQIVAAHADGVVIGHWESLVHARLGYLAKPWDVAILDEAHHMQNRKAQRTETAFDLDAAHRMALTGHPYANGPHELFPILKFLYPKAYTSFWLFWGMHVLVRPKAFGGFEVLGARRPKLLQWEIAPFTLRRTKRDVFKDLPPVTRVRRTAHLTTRGAREYGKLKKEFFAELDAIGHGTKVIPIPSDLARLTRLRQYLIDPGLVGAREPSVKYPVVAELVGDLDGPPVIFTMYQQAGRRLGAYLQKHGFRKIGYIDGDVSMSERAWAKKQFLRSKLDAIVVVIQAGGTALNLGGFGYVIYLDLPWTAKDLEQTEGRVDRPEEGTGRLVATTAYRVVVAGSYEEKMEKKIEKKDRMFRAVFTVNDLKELFA